MKHIKLVAAFVLLMAAPCLMAQTERAISYFQSSTLAYGPLVGGMLQFGSNNVQATNKHLTKDPRSGFCMGAVVSLRKSSWLLESGFEFSKDGYKYNVAQDPEFPLPAHVTNENHNVSFHSLAVPLRAVYAFSAFRLRSMVAIGVLPQLLTKVVHHQKVHYDEGSTVSNVYSEKYRYRSLYPAITLGYAIEYDIDQTVALRLEPQIKFSILPARESNYNTSMNAFSLRLSLLLFN